MVIMGQLSMELLAHLCDLVRDLLEPGGLRVEKRVFDKLQEQVREPLSQSLQGALWSPSV